MIPDHAALHELAKARSREFRAAAAQHRLVEEARRRPTGGAAPTTNAAGRLAALVTRLGPRLADALRSPWSAAAGCASATPWPVPHRDARSPIAGCSR